MSSVNEQLERLGWTVNGQHVPWYYWYELYHPEPRRREYDFSRGQRGKYVRAPERRVPNSPRDLPGLPS